MEITKHNICFVKLWNIFYFFPLPGGSESSFSESLQCLSCATDCLSSWYALVSIEKNKMWKQLVKYLLKTSTSNFPEP